MVDLTELTSSSSPDGTPKKAKDPATKSKTKVSKTTHLMFALKLTTSNLRGTRKLYHLAIARIIEVTAEKTYHLIIGVST